MDVLRDRPSNPPVMRQLNLHHFLDDNAFTMDTVCLGNRVCLGFSSPACKMDVIYLWFCETRNNHRVLLDRLIKAFTLYVTFLLVEGMEYGRNWE